MSQNGCCVVVVLLCVVVVVVRCCSLFVVVRCSLLFVVVVVVVVEWLCYSKRIIIVRWADLSDFFRWFSSVKCVFLFHVQ